MLKQLFALLTILTTSLFLNLICLAAEYEEHRTQDPWELHRIYGDLKSKVTVTSNFSGFKSSNPLPILVQVNTTNYSGVTLYNLENEKYIKSVSGGNDTEDLEPGRYKMVIYAKRVQSGAGLFGSLAKDKVLVDEKKEIEILIEPDQHVTVEIEYNGQSLDYKITKIVL